MIINSKMYPAQAVIYWIKTTNKNNIYFIPIKLFTDRYYKVKFFVSSFNRKNKIK